MNTTNPSRTERAYEKLATLAAQYSASAWLPRRPRPAEPKPAPRVVQVGDRFMIQHPVHGRFLLAPHCPEHFRGIGRLGAEEYAHHLGDVLHDPTRWAHLP